MIKHEDGKWVLYTHDGSKRLGEFPTEQEAIDREREIQFFKHQGQEAVAGVSFVIGRPKGEKTTTVQTVIFEKEAWDQGKARKWLEANDFKIPNVDETQDPLRYRQRPESDFEEGSFKTIQPGQTKESALTLEEKADLVREAYRQKAQASLPPGIDAAACWVGVYDDAILVRGSDDGQLYRIPYTMTGETMDTVTFGDPIAVEVAFVPVSEAEVEIKEPKGNAWAVRVIKAGYSKSVKEIPGTGGKTGRWLYTGEAIKNAPEIFEGAPVYAFEFDSQQFSHLWGLSTVEKVKRGMVGNLIGYLEQVKESGGELLAKLTLLKDRATEAIKEKLADLYRRGRQDLVGLSIDSRVFGVPVETSEGLTFAVMRFAKPATLDVATSPAMGGAFLRALEALPEKEVAMIKELLEKLRARRPDLAAKLGENPTEAQVKEALLLALDPPAPSPADGQGREAIQKDLDESRKLRCSLLLDKRLGDAKLPAPVEAKVRKRYDGRIFEVVALEADIKEEKEVLDALAKEGKVEGLGEAKAEVGLESRDKIQIAMDRMFGASTKEAEEKAKDIPAFKSFRHAFRSITGKSLEDMLNHVIATAQEEITSALWASVLGTSMHRRLIKDYAEAYYGEDRIVSYRPGGVSNFKTQDTLRVQYLADLDTVDPESGDYDEISAPDDEKVSWSVIQKGNLLTITRKTLLNDDLGAATRLVGRLGRAARRTFAKFAWAFAMSNSTYDVDNTAWFTQGHGNLGATALTADQTGVTTLLTALIALGDMTEPGSGEKLGLPQFGRMNITLAVPNALMGVAIRLNQSQMLPDGSNNLYANPFYQFFGANNERIIVNPLFTDTSDYYLFRDPADVDSIEVGFLNDQREPEFFVASVPTIGQMFVADKQQFKARHEYGGDIADYRGAYKEVVG